MGVAAGSVQPHLLYKQYFPGTGNNHFQSESLNSSVKILLSVKNTYFPKEMAKVQNKYFRCRAWLMLSDYLREKKYNRNKITSIFCALLMAISSTR